MARAYCWDMGDGRKVQVRLSKTEQRPLDDLLRGGLQPVRTVLRALALRQLANGQGIRRVARAVEAVSAAAQSAEQEAKQDQPEALSNEWVPLWVPQQEAKIANC